MPLAAALALGGCVVAGTDYRPPRVPVPARWTAGADGRAPDPAVLARWWRQLGDPVLDGLVADALRANLDLATARARLREARAFRSLARADLGPSLGASASGSAARSTAGGTPTTRELYSAGLDASWEPDVFGGLRRGVEAAEADLQAAREDLRATQVTLVAEVALDYVDLRTAELRLRIAEATLVAFRDTYDLARWRFEAGLVSELDVAQARTALERTRAALPALAAEVAEARHRLAVLLGRTPGELHERLVATAEVPVADLSVAVGIPADTLRQRPDVRAAERRLAAQTARLGQAEAALYPRFDLSGSIGLEALDLAALGSAGSVLSLFAGLTAPIFESGRIRAAIRIEDARLEQARLAFRAAVLTALEDVENALVRVATTAERRARLSEATESAREALELAELSYGSGLADFLSVLDSQRTLLELEEALATSTGALAQAQIQLYKALGGGWSREPATRTSR